MEEGENHKDDVATYQSRVAHVPLRASTALVLLRRSPRAALCSATVPAATGLWSQPAATDHANGLASRCYIMYIEIIQACIMLTFGFYTGMNGLKRTYMCRRQQSAGRTTPVRQPVTQPSVNKPASCQSSVPGPS